MNEQTVLITELNSERRHDSLVRLRAMDEAHESVRAEWNGSSLPPPGAFLDFDPVLPEWPDPEY